MRLIIGPFADVAQLLENIAASGNMKRNGTTTRLVDYLRRGGASKRGGSGVRITLDGIDAAAARAPVVDFLVLDEAMTRLGEIKPRYAQIIELRYLTGLTIEETASTLRVSPAAIEREWAFARAWLRRELQPATARTKSTRR